MLPLEPFDYVFSTSQIWDVGIKIQASGIIVERGAVHLSRRRMLHIPKHIPRSHVQWPGLSLGIRIGIKDASVQNEKYETDADKLKSPVATPKIKAKRMGVFHIVEASYTLVAGFKTRFRIKNMACLFGIGTKVN